MQQIELLNQNRKSMLSEPKYNILSLFKSNEKDRTRSTEIRHDKYSSHVLDIKRDIINSNTSEAKRNFKNKNFRRHGLAEDSIKYKNEKYSSSRSRASVGSCNAESKKDRGGNSVLGKLFTVLTKIVIALIVLAIPAYYIYVGFTLSVINIEDPLSNTGTLVARDDDLFRQIIIMTDEEDTEVVGVYIFISNQVSGDSLVYYIPPWVYSDDYSNTFEQPVSVGNLLYMASTVDPEKKYQFVINQISSVVGMIFDSYIYLPTDKASEISDQCKYDSSKGAEYIDKCISGLTNPFNVLESHKLDELIRSLRSNLTYKQIMQLRNRIGAIDFGTDGNGIISNYNGNIIDLSSNNYVIENTAPGDQNIIVSKLVVESIDSIISENIDIVRSKNIQKELVKVEVYNGSGIPKYASKYSRYISNMGCTVVRFGNADKEYEQTTIYVVDPERFQYSLSVVKAILGENVQIINERPNFLTTGDIIVVLGKNVSTSR
ncbi:MAG TPA: LytR C-terminal domain-containing protein [Candidatus Dojkabacteria bacterium]|nr:LytR C-terminal domain-containing protein [Candidatus Dojkabacteria bacterium]